MGPIQKIQEALGLRKEDKATGSTTAAFDHEKVKVIFVLGGPGVGMPSVLCNAGLERRLTV